MNPDQPEPIDVTSETAEFEALQPGERPAGESEPARGRPNWTPDEGDFS
jgi:hypothetical protein